jgi:hypothetical protein
MERTGTGAGDDIPHGAIPVLDQRLRSSIADSDISYRPHILGSNDCHGIEFIARDPWVRTGDDAPTGGLRHPGAHKQRDQRSDADVPKETDLETMDNVLHVFAF